MKLTINWLKQYLETDRNQSELIEGFNKIGLEVEEVVDQHDIYKDFIVAKIISTLPHPEADKLRICQVDNGKETLQIVCGAPNARAGIKVVLAPVDSIIPANGLKIKSSKIRNIESNGMMCSARELAIGDDSSGIIELPENYRVGESFALQHGLNEVIIELSITPNRGDCLGIYGIARDLAAAGFGKLKPLDNKEFIGSFESPIKVKIASPRCSKYIGRYFKNINNQESPIWLQNLLKSIGINPISSLVDITNYFTFAFGRPMHVFDADKINNLEVRQAVDKEKFTALNDKTYQLTENDLVIASGTEIVGLAGIIGEKNSGVSKDSKNIFLEIALFDQDSVTKSGRHHQIDSDAKYRFERRVDSNFLEISLNLATEMILEICGGEYGKEILQETSKYQPRYIDFPLSELKRKIGIEYAKEEVINILSSLGFIIEEKENILSLTIPSWRNDISIKEDIVEEVARISGYDKIKEQELPNIGFVEFDLKQKNLYRISRFAASLGLDEVVTFSFMNSKKASLFAPLNPDLFIKNPISSELDYLRFSILPNLLDAAERNQNRGINNIALFEIASCYKGILPNEQFLCLSGLRTNQNHDKNLYHDERKVDVFDSKADIFAILNEIGIDPSKLQYNINNLPIYYHPGRASALCMGKNIIGYFGELHPKIIRNYNLNGNAVGFELFLDNIPFPKSKFGKKGNINISDYQEVERDFAFIIDQNIEVDSILRNILQLDKKLIRSVNIFDIYSGKGIDENKKSVAFKVTMQAQDHTLTEEEINSLSQKIISSISNLTKGILRSI